jgi:hypothetical protein
MADIKYRLRYVGDEAEQNRLPAHEGAQSLEGVSWSISLITNYLATGDIRTRGAMSPKIKSFLSPARQGSFVNDIAIFITEPNNLFLTSLFGAYTINTISQIVNAVVVKTIKEASGIATQLTDKEKRWLSKFPSGDMEALVDRIEPSLRRAHDVIADGADNLIIQKGNIPVVTLDRSTKAYVNTSIKGDDEVEREVSVGAFNANSGNGRFYLPDTGKTVPFSIDREPASGTYQTLSYSLDRYVHRRPSYIKVKCFEVITTDGRIKKLIVLGARKLSEREIPPEEAPPEE